MIRKIFYPGTYPLPMDWLLFLVRVTTGFFMLTHGAGKFMKLMGDTPVKFADPLGVGATASLSLTVFAEVFCSAALILGVATRLAVIPQLITMLIAAFVIHGNDGFGKQELPLLYALLFFIILIAGAGKISVDNYIYQKLIH